MKARLAGLVLAVVIGILGASGVIGATATAEPLGAAAAPVLVQQPTQAPVGPQIDPAQQADSEKAKSKAIVGGCALALGLIVFWGRHVRSKRRKNGS